VQIHGLQYAAHLNGQNAILESFIDSSQRWRVQLEDGEKKDLKLANIALRDTSGGNANSSRSPASTPRGRSQTQGPSTPRSAPSTPRRRSKSPRIPAPCCTVKLDFEFLQAQLEEAEYSRQDTSTRGTRFNEFTARSPSTTPRASRRDLHCPETTPRVTPVTTPRGSRRDLHCPETTPRGSRRDLHGPETTPRGSRRDLHGPETTPRGSRRDLHSQGTTPRGSRRDLHNPETTPRGSRRDLHNPETTPRGSRRDLHTDPITPTSSTQNLNLNFTTTPPPQMPPSTPRSILGRFVPPSFVPPTPTQPSLRLRPSSAASRRSISAAASAEGTSAHAATAAQRAYVEQQLFNAGWEVIRPPEQVSALKATVLSWLAGQHGRILKTALPDKCAICLDKMKANHCVLKLRCGHAFHNCCIQSWLADSTLCPLCKQCVVPDG